MQKFISVVLLVSVVFVFSGCAAIFKGDSSTLGVNSNPTGAVVYANGAEICSSTPCSVKLKSNQTWNLLFKKQGYKDKTVLVNNKVGAGWIILDILVWIVPMVIDAVTGSWYEFDVDNVNVTLESL